MPEEVSLFRFDPLFESQNHSQLRAGVAHLARIDLFEEQCDVADFISLIQLLRERPFFLGSRRIAASGRRAPSVMQNEHRVIALPEVFVDQFLWASHAAERVFPAHRVECDTPRFAMHRRVPFELATEKLPFLDQPAG